MLKNQRRLLKEKSEKDGKDDSKKEGEERSSRRGCS